MSSLSPIDFSIATAASSISSEFSLNSNVSTMMNTHHTLPVLQQFRSHPSNIGGFLSPGIQNYSTGVSSLNLVQNRASIGVQELLSQESDKKMMNCLQELEKQLLDDNDEEEEGDTVSVVTNNEWSET
ncbi:hypothetical protein KY290_024825 [Solanum tuberosum]|uniref:Uncharacterized protein n=1 Tax=Solanum tuberosum TaxID=4113 RepID=A0ABQ7UUW9_SOLTU|nr:hypothetical protein KY284_023677 [Solanum tuberosum]KAH0754555.1 hypothetical protein KY290_024825 [Solanum tuberosum]